MSKTHSCPSRRFQEEGDQGEGCRAGRVMPPHAQLPAPEPLSATAETLSNGDKFTRSGNITMTSLYCKWCAYYFYCKRDSSPKNVITLMLFQTCMTCLFGTQRAKFLLFPYNARAMMSSSNNNNRTPKMFHKSTVVCTLSKKRIVQLVTVPLKGWLYFIYL